MADAVAKVAAETKTEPIVLSLCEWGWVSLVLTGWWSQLMPGVESSLAMGETVWPKLEGMSLRTSFFWTFP